MGKIRDAERLDHILNILFEEGFGYFIHKLSLHKRIKIHKQIKGSIKNIKRNSEPVRVRKAIEKLGPTFIKFGQILSVRPDLVPKEYITELKKLQEDVPSVPFEEIKKIAEKELGKKLSAVFKKFEETPIASASIAQVHMAELKSGEKVAVKVQKPKVKEIITEDVEIMLFFAHLLNKNFPKFRDYDPVDIVREFADWTFKELDFRKEATNIKKFQTNMKDQKVVIPKIFDSYTSQRLLVMEFENGHHIDTYKFKNEAKKKEFVQEFVNALAKMIFEDGFFHGDPHPGNIFISQNELPLFLDFGMVGELSPELRSKISTIFINLANKDTDLAINNLVDLTTKKEGARITAFKSEVKAIIENWYDQPINKCSFVKTFYDIVSVSAKNRLSMPSNLVLMIKALLDLEGIVLQLTPNANVEDLLRPWIEKMVLKKYDPVALTKSLVTEIKTNQEFYTHIPQHLRNALKKIEEGNFDVHLEDIELTDLKQHIDFTMGTAVLGVTIVALLFSSSLLFALDKDIQVFNFPLSYIEIFVAFTLLLYVFKRNSDMRENYK